MEVVSLNKITRRPEHMIEGWSSMVWSERYFENGEFELKTENVEDTLSMLGEGTMLTLRDTDEVMFVESRALTYEEGRPELTITGRSFESFLENRALDNADYDLKWSPLTSYTSAEMCALLIWNALVNPTSEDALRANRERILEQTVYGLAVTDSVKDGVAQMWWLDKGSVSDILNDFLGLDQLGIRTIRPGRTSEGDLLSFDTSKTASRGEVIRVLDGAPMDELRIDVYRGVDRSKTSTEASPIILHHSVGHIKDPNYLLSIRNYKTSVFVNTVVGPMLVAFETGQSGLDLRYLYLDGGVQGSLSETEYLNALEQKAAVYLGKHRRTVLTDGRASESIPYVYKRDYGLGDRVTLIGEHGFEADMYISEYIRTQDRSGESGHPTLSRV
jgi:hypothetical protein